MPNFIIIGKHGKETGIGNTTTGEEESRRGITGLRLRSKIESMGKKGDRADFGKKTDTRAMEDVRMFSVKAVVLKQS